MWIRSQNKRILLKAKEIRIETEKVKEYISEKELSNYKPEDVHTDILFGEMNIFYSKTEYRYYVYQSIGFIVVNDKRIARYSAEEKALKILDEIHILIDLDAVNGVYQMPQDEEAE